MSSKDNKIVEYVEPGIGMANPRLQSFLKRWDRDLPDDRRCYGIKLLLAGAEQKKVRDGLYRIGVRHILVSYFYLKSWLKNKSLQEIAEDFGRFDFVFLDSGGFTLLQQNQEESGVQVDLHEYTEDYYTEIKRIGSVFSACAEVDLHDTLGMDYCEKAKQELLAEGVPIIPVVHGAPLESYDNLGWFDDYHYLAVASRVLSDAESRGYLNKVYDLCKERGMVIHGFGATSAEAMLRSQFYSCDSSVGADSIVWIQDSEGQLSRLCIGDLYEELGESSSVLHEGRALAEGLKTLTVEDGEEYRQVWSDLKSVVKHTVAKPRVRLKLMGGRELEVTTDHSLFKMSVSGELYEISPENLSIGDWVVCPMAQRWQGAGVPFLEVPVEVPIRKRGRQWHDGPHQKVSFGLSQELLELFGFWIGDGSYNGDTSVAFSCGIDFEPVEMVKSWAKSIGRKATVTKKNDVLVSHCRYVRAMRNIGLIGHSHTKRLPDWFWNLSEDQACALLRGLFSADGSGKGNRPYLATTSEELAHQVREALESILQTPVSKSPDKNGGYRIAITGMEAVRLFAEKIGFFIERKQFAMDIEGIPRWSRFSEISTELAINDLVYPSGDKVLSRRVPRTTDGFCKRVLSDDLLYLPVVGMEPLEDELIDVYDLEVPGTQRFVANGVLAHNTTWLGGSRYGNTMVFENGKIRHYDHKNKEVRKRFKKRFEENGVIWEDIEAEKGFEVDMMNALAWKQLGDYVKYTARNCYWLTPEEKDKALTLKSESFGADGLIDRSASLARTAARRSIASSADYDDRSHEMLLCDVCHMSGRCPRFKAGEACGYDINVKLESKKDLQKMLQVLLEAQYGRVMTGVLFEKLEGGVLDRNLSSEIQRTVALVSDIRTIFSAPQDEIQIKARGSSGTLSSILAGVFSPTGSGKSGSGNTTTQRAAAKVMNAVLDDDDYIDAESEPIDE